jgi:hypothetical protein
MWENPKLGEETKKKSMKHQVRPGFNESEEGSLVE